MSIIGVSRSRSAAVVVTAAVSLTLVAGCSGAATTDSSSGAQATTGVASIQQPSAAASATAVSAERPLIRLDASDEEITRAADVFTNCLLTNGLPKAAVMKGGYTIDPANISDAWGPLSDKVRADLKKNCASKQPEFARDRARRLDPAYADHMEAFIKCLNDHDIKAVLQDGELSSVDVMPTGSKAHWMQDCEQEGFASYYSTLK
ncbi:hypothetical protein [Actinoplanes awajinensis]|uniref:Lipoprotein n=1 Tax=Actinoplanes awajinensis subsp. mycoplanecinus TaxID=135947 RepID=A0A101JRM3_9ACTN|nr:hypothetical protein [Actinoplanes awajinensis]KUL31755.1 hypothetical protein ADL15_21510 [Actinoplanes awajinensis subsp. mycoplanecinus]